MVGRAQTVALKCGPVLTAAPQEPTKKKSKDVRRRIPCFNRKGENIKRSIIKSSRSLCGVLATCRCYLTSCACHDPPPRRPLSLFSTWHTCLDPKGVSDGFSDCVYVCLKPMVTNGNTALKGTGLGLGWEVDPAAAVGTRWFVLGQRYISISAFCFLFLQNMEKISGWIREIQRLFCRRWPNDLISWFPFQNEKQNLRKTNILSTFACLCCTKCGENKLQETFSK